MVTRTETNEYGEFQFEFEPQEQLRMSVVTRAGGLCELRWEIWSNNAGLPQVTKAWLLVRDYGRK